MEKTIQEIIDEEREKSGIKDLSVRQIISTASVTPFARESSGERGKANKGRKHTDEAKQKIGSGPRVVTQKMRDMAGERGKANKGRKHTDETKQKIGSGPRVVTQKMRDMCREKSSKYIYMSDKGEFTKQELINAYPEFTSERLSKWAQYNKNGFSRKLK